MTFMTVLVYEILWHIVAQIRIRFLCINRVDFYSNVKIDHYISVMALILLKCQFVININRFLWIVNKKKKNIKINSLHSYSIFKSFNTKTNQFFFLFSFFFFLWFLLDYFTRITINKAWNWKIEIVRNVIVLFFILWIKFFRDFYLNFCLILFDFINKTHAKRQ